MFLEMWDKQGIVVGRSDYHFQHEHLVYGWKPGAKRTWVGDRKQRTIIPAPGGNLRRGMKDMHPSTMPLELVTKTLGNSAKKGSRVLDTFLGSGSTLLAAEQLGVLCHGMELDPRYLAVTLERCSRAGLVPEREQAVTRRKSRRAA